ncbi:MAG TPA: PadR family transcriptional regulator [Fimbriimonadaceae bacterium]|jgi:DNA-binding PadR family transcriptional regulator
MKGQHFECGHHEGRFMRFMWEGRERGHRGRGGREFGFGRGHGRGERFLEQGDLRWLILDLLGNQPRHGYEIIKEIEDMVNGQYSPSPGVVYPTLTYLEETGLVASEQQGSKKLYSLTDKGRASLDENKEAFQAIKDRVEHFKARFGGPPAPELLRAFANLRAAIQVRLAKGEISPDSIANITAAIDKAAGDIERS